MYSAIGELRVDSYDGFDVGFDAAENQLPRASKS